MNPDPSNPEIIDQRAAWYCSDIADNSCWQFALDEADNNELDQALKSAQRQLQTIAELSADTFPLAKLQSKLSAIASELESGCGFVRLRGVDLERWSATDLEWVWMGLACHLGRPVWQNPQGQILREIKAESGDIGQKYGQLPAEGGQFLSSRARTASNAELRYHTDRTDIVGLLCTGVARTGGMSKIASSVTVHNEMLRRYPKLCELLYEPLARSRVGEEIGGEQAWYQLPVWGTRNGDFTSHYSRTYVEALEHVDDAPQVTTEQWQALDTLALLAEEHHLSMQLIRGDIQFLNNHVIYHSRGAFEDDIPAGLQRCLWRIWLSAPHRALPESHAVLWREVEAGRIRGGISGEPISVITC